MFRQEQEFHPRHLQLILSFLLMLHFHLTKNSRPITFLQEISYRNKCLTPSASNVTCGT